jgi:hypothetical protein
LVGQHCHFQPAIQHATIPLLQHASRWRCKVGRSIQELCSFLPPACSSDGYLVYYHLPVHSLFQLLGSNLLQVVLYPLLQRRQWCVATSSHTAGKGTVCCVHWLF